MIPVRFPPAVTNHLPSVLSCLFCLLILHVFQPLLAGPPEGVPAKAVKFQGEGLQLPAWTDGNELYLEIPAEPDVTVRIPRLANVVKTVDWAGKADSKISVQPEPTRWIIKPGAVPEGTPSILAISLDSPPRIFNSHLTAAADANGMIFLPAKFAMTHGDNLRFEPQPHKNTVGYWSNEKNTAEWRFKIANAGVFEVDILQGCGKGHGGSEVEVKIDNQSVTFQVVETGHFQNFVWRPIGQMKLSEVGEKSLTLVPKKKAGGAVMDVRAIRLAPVGTARTFEPELADPQALPEF